jgi:hypothetical protein
MTRIASSFVLASAFLWPMSHSDGGPYGPAPDVVPFFDAHQTIEVRIEAPLKTIFKERGQESTEHPGLLIAQLPGGDSLLFDVKIKTRGKSRLRKNVCGFPPIRLNFKKTQVENTIFAGLDKVKMVTHCQDGKRDYEQYVLQEYLIYRSYHLLHEVSFRTRLARVTYVDTDGSRDTVTSDAFLLEDDDTVAERNGWEVVKATAVPPDYVDPWQLALVGVFQYLIGNTDFSFFLRELGKEDCCHNMKPIGSAGGPVFVVPYDFDLAGVIETRYANRLYKPKDRNLGIWSVRDRRYRGMCDSAPLLDDVFRTFNDKKDAIYALYSEQEGLDPKVLEKTLEYYDEFFEVINDPGKVERELTDHCRSPGQG